MNKETNLSKEELVIPSKTVLRIIALVVATVLLLFLVKAALPTLTLIGVAIFLSLALNSPVRWLARHLPGKKRNKRTLATAISIAVIMLLFAGFLYAIVPPLAKQTTTFVRSIPSLVDDTKNGKGPIGTFVKQHNLERQVEQISQSASSKLDDISTTAISTISAIGMSIISVLTVIVLVVMMLIEGPRWGRLFMDFVPDKNRSRFLKVAQDMNKVIQGYVNGQVTLAAVAAIIITPVFFIMQVNYPLALMVIVFICGLIPMVGHTIGAIICTLVALFTSLPAALVVLTFYILYQQIENYAVQPRVQSNSTNMSPLLVFVSVIIGANFGGLLGGLVAIPVAGCIRILLLDYLHYRGVLSRETVVEAKTPKKKA